jgi:ferredoxin-type protein NapH
MVAMAGTEPSIRPPRIVRWRAWIQAGFLLVWLDPLMLRMHTVCGPVFHCYSCPLATFACPIGVVANFSSLHLVPFIAVGTLVAVGAVFGSLVCGWACPFGFLQDLIGRVPVPKFTLPRWTSWFRYVVLGGLVVLVPFVWGDSHPLFICRLCPAGALEGAMPNVVRQAVTHQPITLPSTAKLTIMVLILLAALVKWRPWCSLFCPLGATFALFNRVSVFTLRFRTDRCRDCTRCDQECRYGIVPSLHANTTRCIRCLECTRCDAVTLGTVFSQDKTHA